MSYIRTRWAAIGAAVAVSLGGGGIGLVAATSPSDAVAYQPITPCRMADTRSNPAFNVGERDTPLAADETHTIAAISPDDECGEIPKNVSGLQLNVTALGATAPTFLAVWGGGEQPNASSLNPTPGQPPTPNAVTTGLDADGDFHIYNKAGFVDVIIDVVGIYVDHDHDDRYYTKTQVDSKLATKADDRVVYTQDQVDELVAAQRVIARSDVTGNAPDLPGGSFGTFGLVSLEVDRPGLLQITGSVRYQVDPDDVGNCFLSLDGTDLDGSLRVMRGAGFCSTNVAAVVAPGSYNVRLRGFSDDALVIGGASLDVLFVPGGTLQE